MHRVPKTTVAIYYVGNDICLSKYHSIKKIGYLLQNCTFKHHLSFSTFYINVVVTKRAKNRNIIFVSRNYLTSSLAFV